MYSVLIFNLLWSSLTACHRQKIMDMMKRPKMKFTDQKFKSNLSLKFHSIVCTLWVAFEHNKRKRYLSVFRIYMDIYSLVCILTFFVLYIRNKQCKIGAQYIALEIFSRKMCHHLVQRFITLSHILTLFPDTQVLNQLLYQHSLKL